MLSLNMSSESESWILDGQFLPHNTLLLVTTFLATITNSLLLHRFYVNRFYLKPAHMSLVSISLSDFLSTLGGFITFAMHTSYRELPWFWCQFSGIFCCITGASALSFCVMGVERYCQIVLQKTFRRAHISLILLICWIFSLFLAFFPIIFQTYHVPQSAPVYCLPNFTGRTPLQFIVSVASIIAIVSVISINFLSYFMIYKKAVADGFKWNSRSPSITAIGGSGDNESRATRLHSVVTSTNAEGKKQKNNSQRKQMELTIKLAMVTLSFCIAWFGTGASFTYQIISGNGISPELDVLCTALTSVFSAFNPLMVLTMDKRWKIDTSCTKFLWKSNNSSNDTVNVNGSAPIKRNISVISKIP
ncbi:hypothetical protein BKA69DRAFT_920788 [Paraphysoderma sedebokerense]|nr:hypothetical protein BKA69DRAFT_920788 [Paraphysoderma sedebokerense]